MTPLLFIAYWTGSRITWSHRCRWRKSPSVRVIQNGAQKLKQSNEPILYLAERYGFESQQTLTRTFKNYFDVPPHKYRMTNMHGETRYLLPLNHYNC